ncbi:MAG: HAMP domain-containing protein [candidate division Zixibacteria bacterium]|nr:HAMP domain-containing protein [candidate division Zixibacteria bacterium]
MKSGLRKKLFRLFLLFSLAPAILLTILGYYLALETTGFLETGDSNATGLATYYNNRLFAAIDTSLAGYIEDTTRIPVLPDFLIATTGEHIRKIKLPPDMSQRGMERILSGEVDRDRGFVQDGRTVIQYVTREYDDGKRLYAGLVHGPEYADLLARVQTDLASRANIRELRSRYMFFLASVFAAVSILTITTAYFFSARISKTLSQPLAELSAASKEIATGDFRQEIEPAGTDEIRELIYNFNRMARQLDLATTKLAQTERVAAWRNVARRFAHELKNPLQPVLISLYRMEKLLKDSPEYDQVKEPLRAASEELKHLTTLADRFSELAKLPPPNVERVNVGELLDSVAELYREQLADYDFTFRAANDVLFAELDPAYFREALHNLLQNAADASKKQSRISLELSASYDRIDIVVRDFGEGMTAETVASARLPYFTTKQKGSGLGLAVVEKVVTECGGQLLIDTLKGSGTIVTVSLPRTE